MNRRVLIVDAEKPVCQAGVEILSPQGFEVATAESGADALDVIGRRGASGAFDAILFALRLPDIPGTDLLFRLHELQTTATLAMICGFGYDYANIMVKARRAGLRYTIYKPFRREQLLDLVERLIAPSPTAASLAECASRRHG